jgi:hypothetical protein
MAEIKGLHSISGVDVLELDSDPTIAPGAQAKVGSFAIVSGLGLFQKQSVNPMDWEKINTKMKSGRALLNSFTGVPRKSTVAFTKPMPSASYSVHITGTNDVRSWTVESRTVTGFVINSNASAPLLGDVYWSAKLYEENG